MQREPGSLSRSPSQEAASDPPSDMEIPVRLSPEEVRAKAAQAVPLAALSNEGGFLDPCLAQLRQCPGGGG